MTHEMLMKLPCNVLDTIEYYRNIIDTDLWDRNLYIAKADAYVSGLHDAGLITDLEATAIRGYFFI